MSNPEQLVPHNPATLLADPLTGEYVTGSYSSGYYLTRSRPPFTLYSIDEMLTDPKVIYGLRLLKGPIANSTLGQCVSSNSEVKAFVDRQLKQFKLQSIGYALRALDYGYSPCEVIYRLRNNQIEFAHLKPIHPRDAKVVTLHGDTIGLRVRNIPVSTSPASEKQELYLGGMKCFNHLHNRERNPYYGVSRLYDCYIPWWETWTDGGYRDIRRLWFFKNSYEGGTMYHPPGNVRMPNGEVVANKDLARQMIEQKRVGGTLTLPNTPSGDASGVMAWRYEPPVANPAPGDLLSYGATLGTEILEGLGIPPELVESGGNQGFGSASGRQVPAEAFYAIVQELLNWLLYDFTKFVLRPLVLINYDYESSQEFEVEPVTLGKSETQQMGQNPMEQAQAEGKATEQDPGKSGEPPQKPVPENGYNGNQYTDASQKAFAMR